jgi:hypothetical protein
MLSFLLLAIAAGLLSAVLLFILVLLVCRRLFGRRPGRAKVEPLDPFVSAQIDMAASKWASERGRPEAAHIMAGKLRLLYEMAQRRGEA